MSDKEKIRAEIERRYNERDRIGDNIRANVHKSLISFIDSLQEEHVSEDLEEFIIAKYNEVIGFHGEYDKTYIDGMAKAAAIECGIVGAQWRSSR